MAIAIKGIPILKNGNAEDFVKKADIALSRKASVDFKKQFKSAVSILKKVYDTKF